MKGCASAADRGVVVRARRALMPLLLLLSAGAAGGGCCAETSRRYEIDAPDDALAAMVEACHAGIATSTCASQTAPGCAPQACIDVCKSVMTIAGDDPHGLTFCLVNPATPSGAALEVIVTFCS